MKSHVILKMRTPLPIPSVPYWMDFIGDKFISIERFENDLDAIWMPFNLRYWITREYKPKAGNHFSEDESRSGLDRIYRVILQTASNIPVELINRLRFSPMVESVRPIEILGSELPKVSMATSVGLQMDASRDLIYLRQAHLFSKGSESVKIAVLDTGIDLVHPELKGVIADKMDFVNIQGLDTTQFIGDTTGIDNSPEDEVGHGTHVAGIIAGRGLNMPLGVVPECKIMAVRVLATLQQGEKRVGAGLIDNINAGIKWAVDQGADIINMSLGVKHEGGGLPHAEVIEYALSKGVSIVAASGNDGTHDKYYPGALPGVIAVGASDGQGNIANFSTYGAHITLLAPGANIYSSYRNRAYAFSSGTSQASPFVAGGIALLKSYALTLGERLTDGQVKYVLKHSSDKVTSKFKDMKSGYGALNLLDAVKLLKYSLS